MSVITLINLHSLAIQILADCRFHVHVYYVASTLAWRELLKWINANARCRLAHTTQFVQNLRTEMTYLRTSMIFCSDGASYSMCVECFVFDGLTDGWMDGRMDTRVWFCVFVAFTRSLDAQLSIVLEQRFKEGRVYTLFIAYALQNATF